MGFAGPVLWNIVFRMYTKLLFESLKVRVILPPFRGGSAGANESDNHMGITSFTTFCKTYKMVS